MTSKTPHLHALALALATVLTPTLAQDNNHSEHTPTTTAEPVSEDSHAGHGMPVPDSVEADQPASEVDHAAMGHAMPATPASAPVDHSSMQGMDHAAMGHDLPATAAPIEPIPPVTASDRAAAFPDVAGHAVHDKSIHSYFLLDRLETWDDDGDALAWETLGWVGTDLNRLWVRSEGEAIDGHVESGDVEVFYGRAMARWWDAVIGIRHDFGEDPSQTFAAFGVMGVAPYKFEVSATVYVGQGGQAGLGVEAEYEMLLTNRLIAQWLAEAEVWGEDNSRRGIGSGLSTVEAGLRLRYEFTRQFAPYIGVAHERAYGGTADLRRADGDDIDDTRVVAGVRIWF